MTKSIALSVPMAHCDGYETGVSLSGTNLVNPIALLELRRTLAIASWQNNKSANKLRCWMSLLTQFLFKIWNSTSYSGIKVLSACTDGKQQKSLVGALSRLCTNLRKLCPHLKQYRQYWQPRVSGRVSCSKSQKTARRLLWKVAGRLCAM
ncbi:hypothetical protein V5G28_009135 [Scytonema sp. PRP1]